MRGKPQYRELKLVGCEAQQAAEAAAYARSWEDSVVLDIFSWQLQSTMTCRACGKASHAFDSAQELLVAIPPGSNTVTVQVEGQGGRGAQGLHVGVCADLGSLSLGWLLWIALAKQLEFFTDQPVWNCAGQPPTRWRARGTCCFCC